MRNGFTSSARRAMQDRADPRKSPEVWVGKSRESRIAAREIREERDRVRYC